MTGPRPRQRRPMRALRRFDVDKEGAVMLSRSRWTGWAVAFVVALLLAPLAAAGAPGAAAQEAPDKIRVDYAYYNPSSLVLRRFGRLEEELAAEAVEVEG